MKQATMRILACFMPASSGTAQVAGHDVFRESLEVRRRIGYLPESVPLYGDLRVAPYLRSEEHTSELQSPCNLVCRLLLEKKKKIKRMTAYSIDAKILAAECS